MVPPRPKPLRALNLGKSARQSMGWNSLARLGDKLPQIRRSNATKGRIPTVAEEFWRRRRTLVENAGDIIGASKLVEIFGYWPTFHDAEVLWLRLDRQSYQKDSPPSLDAGIHVFEMTNEVGPDGAYLLQKHTLAHLQFRGVEALRLEYFNHQNALFGLRISNVRDCQLGWVRWEVDFDGSFGVNASFQCHDIEVMSATPCSGSGELSQPA